MPAAHPERDPLRRLTGWNELIRVRRLIGLTAFWYALLHFLSYLVFDHSPSVSNIAADIAKHPWVLFGFAAFLMRPARRLQPVPLSQERSAR